MKDKPLVLKVDITDHAFGRLGDVIFNMTAGIPMMGKAKTTPIEDARRDAV